MKLRDLEFITGWPHHTLKSCLNSHGSKKVKDRFEKQFYVEVTDSKDNIVWHSTEATREEVLSRLPEILASHTEETIYIVPKGVVEITEEILDMDAFEALEREFWLGRCHNYLTVECWSKVMKVKTLILPDGFRT